MARRAVLTSPELSDDDVDREGNNTSSRQHGRRVTNPQSTSPSPTASFSSDKENRSEGRSRTSNGKSRAMAPPSKLPTTGSEEPTSGRASKRRRLGERDAPNETQAAHQKRLDEAGDRSVYDPDQTIEERRAIRKEYRDLSRELTDSRAEYLQTNSNGLVATLEKANDLYGNVKQTSDATLDSRLLVSTADLSVKRTQQLNLGDGGQGIDVDDFINKCRSFMRRADSSFQAPESTQRRRRRGYEAENDSAAEASADEGDEYNWEWLGRQACFPSNLRPPVPGFLLGPLSVQKRARKQTQRRERLRRQDPRDAIRPEEVKVTENEKAENNNLTFLCNKIRALLGKMQAEGQEAAQNEATDDMTEDELLAVFEKHGLAPDGGIPLFRFVINPNSFGQSVENLFYTSFLIKEGRFGVEFDSRGLPTLHMAETAEERRERYATLNQDPEPLERHQAVFHLDFETWEDLIDAFDIKESTIPHRDSEEVAPVSASGWYG